VAAPARHADASVDEAESENRGSVISKLREEEPAIKYSYRFPRTPTSTSLSLLPAFLLFVSVSGSVVPSPMYWTPAAHARIHIAGGASRCLKYHLHTYQETRCSHPLETLKALAKLPLPAP